VFLFLSRYPWPVVRREFFLSTVASCTLRTGEVLVQSVGFLSLAAFFKLALYVWIGLICNLMNLIWFPIGLNLTVSLKCSEMTFVVIWHYINKTDLNWTEIHCSNAIIQQLSFVKALNVYWVKVVLNTKPTKLMKTVSAVLCFVLMREWTNTSC